MVGNATEGRIRASDAERDQVAALLSKQVAPGRLTMGEFEKRVEAAFAAQTREQLHDLTADLPADASHESTAPEFDPCLLCFLLFACPPAALVYWLMWRRAGGSQQKAGDDWDVPQLSTVSARYVRVGAISHG
jgi:hypothetical protein